MSTPAAAGRLLDLLKIDIPLIQAPMAGVSTPPMAAAVSGAGALGSLGLGASTPDQARAMIRAVRERTSRPFGVNLFVHQPAQRDAAREAAWIDRLRPLFDRFGATPPAELREIYPTFRTDDAMLAMLLEERPAVVSFHFGLPDAGRVRALRAAGIALVASATSLDEARQAVAAGMDAVVAQGYEAGGHRGVFDPDVPDDRLGTLALTRLLARDLAVPVIAAGGIMDGAGIAAVLALGAGAAQLGTAFVSADESAADAGYRAALKGPAAHHTIMTRAISGRPARSLANAFTRLGESLPPDAVPAYPVAYDAGKALNAAAKAAGDTGYGAQWAGQGAPLARFLPAAQIVAELAAELAYARRHG
ncbi:NAD(P)H-dependent flavin oxidoreductase [Nitrospirillum amazonense]|uniref:Nitronate monooxygenase n=1 Tax=Nitrospirillum amazonense TaxID=28077 RepID=A0A560K4D2_9PROT|nr:nitronate monooxygenase [Nitrospirillum amazonense]MDG3440185.1 nitronate monooxygenase [Nitrospirillum amazonense]TWB75480.1 nitronate monooxygenase [Nitrospirillum amazonense]